MRHFYRLMVAGALVLGLLASNLAVLQAAGGKSGSDTPVVVREIPRHYPVDDATFARMKAALDAKAGLPNSSPRSLPPGPAPLFPTISMTQTTAVNPPDGALAVGPSSVLVGVNVALATYDKTTGNVISGPLAFQTFFNSTDNTFSDPRAIFDIASGRFIVLMDTMSNFYLAASKGNNPTLDAGDWCQFTISNVTGSGAQAAVADYPGLGMDGDNLYITSNQFTRRGFQFARVLAIPKTQVYPSGSVCPAGAPSPTAFNNLTNPGGGLAFTVEPANQPDASSGTGMLFVNTLFPSGTSIVVRQVYTQSGSLHITSPVAVTVPGYTTPANAPQPSGKRIDTGDVRILDATQRNGKIYTANNTGPVSGNGSLLNSASNGQWYAIDVSNPAAPTLASSGAISSASTAYYYPGLMPTGPTAGGNAFVGFEISGSSSTLPASAYWGRIGSAPTSYAGGMGGYKNASRWGDYPGVAADPSSDSTVWVLGEYAATQFAWGTAVTGITSTGTTP